MKLTEKEEKIARLALDPSAKDGERASAAKKLIESLMARGVSVEDIQESGMGTGDLHFDPAPAPGPPAGDGWSGYRTASSYEPTPEEAAAGQEERERAAREEKAAEEARQREAAEVLAQEEVRKAQEAAWPLYMKVALGLGRFLGPYSKYSWYRLSNPGKNGKFEETANLVFGFILMVVLGLAVISGIGAFLSLLF